jgi:hypothetical protein
MLNCDARQEAARFRITGIEMSENLVHNLSTFRKGIIALVNPSLGQCSHRNACSVEQTAHICHSPFRESTLGTAYSSLDSNHYDLANHTVGNRHIEPTCVRRSSWRNDRYIECFSFLSFCHPFTTSLRSETVASSRTTVPVSIAQAFKTIDKFKKSNPFASLIVSAFENAVKLSRKVKDGATTSKEKNGQNYLRK